MTLNCTQFGTRFGTRSRTHPTVTYWYSIACNFCRKIHNPEVTGSNPVFATRQNPILKSIGFFGVQLPSFGLIKLVQTEASERSKIISVLFLFYVHFTLMQNPSTPLSINQAKTAKRFEDIILNIHFLCSSKENEPKGKTPRQQAFPSDFISSSR